MQTLPRKLSKAFFCLSLLIGQAIFCFCPAQTSASQSIRKSLLTRSYITPSRIVLQKGDIKNADLLLKTNIGQAINSSSDCVSLKSTREETASIVLDFGKEIHGGIFLSTGAFASGKPVKVRIRFGESVSEACCDITQENGATNDHAIRDFEVTLPWLGCREVGNSGFRFVRIDLIDTDTVLLLREANAILVESDYRQIGSFKCSDQRLNDIWETGRYTVKLNMQDYIWDGIKRDRLVWIGDMYPEVMTISNVYGNVDIVPRSLDFASEGYTLPRWINDISSYSMWWVLIQYKWFMYTGDIDYLKSNRDYLKGVLKELSNNIGDDNHEHLGAGMRFLDWPTNADTNAVDTGLHALMLITMEKGAELCSLLSEKECADLCKASIKALSKANKEIVDEFFSKDTPFDSPGRKQALSLMALSGMIPAEKAAQNILYNSSKGFSTFYGYYMLDALAKAGKYAEAMDIISEYWGAMLDLGATTFWEDFDIDWTKNASRIDELPEEGKIDVHKSYGGYCYKGFRHSLCHGWASGPTSWLSEHVLGLSPADAGQKKVNVNPHLGNLSWAEGTYPTPYGVISIKVTPSQGKGLDVEISAPKEIELLPAKGVHITRK